MPESREIRSDSDYISRLSGISRIERMTCGYRNRKRFHHAIYFRLGNLYPETIPRLTKG